MPSIDVNWDNEEKTILRWDFHPNWQWTDVPAAGAKTHELLAGITHEVSIIYNSNRTAIPLSSALQNLRYLMQREPSYRGLTIIANTSGFGIQLVQIIMKVFHVREGKLAIVETLDEARALVAHRTAKAMIQPLSTKR